MFDLQLEFGQRPGQKQKEAVTLLVKVSVVRERGFEGSSIVPEFRNKPHKKNDGENLSHKHSYLTKKSIQC
jgi:hypothetical protein